MLRKLFISATISVFTIINVFESREVSKFNTRIQAKRKECQLQKTCGNNVIHMHNTSMLTRIPIISNKPQELLGNKPRNDRWKSM